ncbi:LytTR family DNA-binding domain-containing protein [Ferrimonas sp. SCSIO 43195]|uniref:LytR/AlgR family response regulator transcription factor n=1 Tax=Ferrimonas sp. SCSIO 43195 TaxID=2822844 RepID=UPI0020762F48|nr:LytTR family DNA-binding domain-containing protein [Ferrimonas sp. SCSIO 43195]USD38944.1 response regulator transcription factor [Ferrimonas sp. SCSIO 43195]
MTEIVTAVIADDEPLLRHHLDRALAQIWPQLQIVASAANGQQALEAIHRHQPDVVFLDIRMPKLDGMALAGQLARLSTPPLVVFTTAYDEYALRAFDNNAVDYLLKPLSDERLQQACHKLQQRLASQAAPAHDHARLQQLMTQLSQLAPAMAKPFLSWIKASRQEEIHLIAIDDVLYFKADDKYVSLFTRVAGETPIEYLIRSSLKELLPQLDPDCFWQIHRSTIVNVAAIDRVTKEFGGKLKVQIGPHSLAVSRSAQSLFKEM